MQDLKNKLKKIANAQRIQLTENELETFSQQAQEVLLTFDKLDKIDTENVQPSYHPVDIPVTFREDVVEKSTSPTENHVKKEKNYLVGPRMMK